MRLTLKEQSECGKNGMGCYVLDDKNSMGCYVRGDKNTMGCFVPGGKSLWDVLSGMSKNGMGCFVRFPCGLHFRGFNLGIQIVVIVSSNTRGKSLVHI